MSYQQLTSILLRYTLPITTIALSSLIMNGASASIHSHSTTTRSVVTEPDKYIINPHHAHVRFSVTYMKTSTITGGVGELTGGLQFSNTLQQGSINLDIPMKRIHTGSKLFMKTLKGKDFFDVKNYPTAKFTSTKWHFSDNAVQSIDGLLTIHGKTNKITLTTNRFNCYLSPIAQKTVCGGDFSAVIDRTQWGMSKYLMMVSKEVRVNIEIEAIKK